MLFRNSSLSFNSIKCLYAIILMSDSGCCAGICFSLIGSVVNEWLLCNAVTFGLNRILVALFGTLSSNVGMLNSYVVLNAREAMTVYI